MEGSRIVTESIGSKLLVYLYDESGSPIGLQYRQSSYAANQYDTFFFEKNIFGDIVAVYNENGDKIGSYTYDAWGICTTATESGITVTERSIVRTYNPFRYRGYYYDTDIGLYYLQSRYYNPQWGRFLNADGYINANGDLIGFNMYAYCSNNPVMNVDPTGHGTILAFAVLSSFYIIPIVLLVGVPLYEMFRELDDISLSGELVSSDSSVIDHKNFEERTFWYDISGSGGGSSYDGSALDVFGNFLSIEAGLDKGTYSWDYFEMSFGLMKASGELSASILEGIGGSASFESMHGSAFFKIPVFDHQLRIGASGNLGGIGAKCKIGLKTEIGVSFIVGGSIIVEWD